MLVIFTTGFQFFLSDFQPLEWILGEPKDKSEKLSGREPGTFYIYPCDPFTDGGNKEEYRCQFHHHFNKQLLRSQKRKKRLTT
jgi:hypothetical protein